MNIERFRAAIQDALWDNSEECGSCGMYHHKNFSGDCREDAERFHPDDVAEMLLAAPNMLEALQYVVDYHREHDSGEGELFGLDFVTTCIAAIRKATGK